MAGEGVKDKVQDAKNRVQEGLDLVKRGNFLDQREKILGEEKPEVFPKIRNKVEGWEPGSIVKGEGAAGDEILGQGRPQPPIRRPGDQGREEEQPSPDENPLGYELH